MSELVYRDRVHPFARERIFRLDKDALHLTNAERHRTIAYADIKFIEAFHLSFVGDKSQHLRWILHPEEGPPITLTSAMRNPWRVVDHMQSFHPFVRELERRVVAVNPDLYFVEGRKWLNRAGGIGGKITVLLMRLVRNTNPDGWADAAAWVMRRVGPRTRGHRCALEQLALAFPEKTPAERERIAVGMWDNLARTTIEYSQLERLWDYDPARPGHGRIIIDPDSARRWAEIKAADRPSIGWSMHYGNWELAGIAIPNHGLRNLLFYRPTKIIALTNELVRARTAAGTTAVAAGPSIIHAIRREFQGGTVLGMLIDQRDAHGIDVTFFGRPTKLNQLCARVARTYDCPVYAARVIRVERRRFRCEHIGPLELPRDQRGRVDVQGATQLFASIMEAWIREYPEQWMWLHRIWR